MRILSYSVTEDSTRIMRHRLASEAGIVIQPLLTEQPLPPGIHVFGHLTWSTWRYDRPSNGQTIWAVEVERFEGPDIQYWATWLLDEAPQTTTVVQLLENEKSQAIAASV